MSNSAFSRRAYRRYLATEDHLRDPIRQGKRNPAEAERVLRAIIEPAKEAPQELREQPKLVRGSDLVVTLDDCTKFVREFGGAKDADCAQWVTAEAPIGVFWPIPDAGLSYEELVALVAKVPHYEWVSDQFRAINVNLDPRQTTKPGRLLWTPAGIKATEACPDLVGVSYRCLWEMQDGVVTAREAVILWLFIYWKFTVMLDTTGWTRTCSRSVGGRGVCVRAFGQGLSVDWSNPDSAHPSGGSRSVVLG